jgi:hypothetical protein|tara:strand:- start:243 stop:569 length:327 start_codon:yes stop_codon:yes gene_type:complete
MEDEGQRAEEIDRGNKAKVILSDPLFQEAFDQLRELYMNAWEQTTIKDSDTRERLWMMIANLGDVKAHLKTVLETGQMSEQQLDDLDLQDAEDSGVLKRKLKQWGVRT